MKILHTSDLHFGISLCGVPLLKYQWEFCDSLCRLVSDNSIDAVIVSGDVFDTNVASADAIKCWSYLATKLCLEMKTPVVVCAGNHDGAARLASCADLLKAAGLHISGTLEDAFVPIKVGNCEIYSLPYYNTADAAAVLDCKADAGAVMAEVAKRILDGADKSKKLILSAHCFAAGGKAAESDVSARTAESVGGADLVPCSAFEGFDYVALGHLHRPQTLSFQGTIIRYSGTPMPYSFGEAQQNKTVSVFDTDSGTVTELEVPQPYKLRNIEGTYEEVLRNGESDPDSEDFVKIKITDKYAGNTIFSQLRRIYPNLLMFSGKQSRAESQSGITAAETAELDPGALAVKFAADHLGRELDEDEMRWLEEAIAEIDGDDKL
ncbi:MAG: exonuclease SbcCD subunit D [Oscillospiraceae bacterium]|nr:exonuclease SbcCD subunit D [Oscillospiraceae bacterium]